MSVSDLQTRLPLYQTQLNWNELWSAYPVPDVFTQTVFTWSRDRIMRYKISASWRRSSAAGTILLSRALVSRGLGGSGHC